MSQTYFQFKQFTIHQDRTAMKVTTDGCLFGAWVSSQPQNNSKEHVLDIGTGTGLLALMFAQNHPEALIDAIELEPGAAMQAEENVNSSKWSDHVSVIQADARDFTFLTQYDRIICNPPFYENELKGISGIRSMAHHDSGILLSELFRLVRQNLATTGKFYCMIPFKRMKETEELLRENGFKTLQKIRVRQSTAHGVFRVFYEAERMDTTVTNTILNDLSIKSGNQEYTKEFKLLLSPYYLHL
jgi:tRNA1Val (adenine37-N6)-methyltransferase